MRLRWLANGLLFGLLSVSGLVGTEVTMGGSVERGNMHQDPHSFSNPEEAVVEDLMLDATVDFSKKQITGKATLQIENKKGVRKLYLDSESLHIERVTLGNPEQASTFKVGKSVQYLGEPLIIDIQPDTNLVNIYYSPVRGLRHYNGLSPRRRRAANSRSCIRSLRPRLREVGSLARIRRVSG